MIGSATHSDVPPHDLDAERALISSMVRRPDLFDECDGIVEQGRAFYHDGHGLVWGIIGMASKEGLRFDDITVAAALGDQMEQYGGRQWLSTLIHAHHSGWSATYYAGIVRDKWERRGLRRLHHEIAQWCEANDDPTEVWARIRQRGEAFDAGRQDQMATSAADVVAESVALLESADVAISTGFASFDKNLGGGLFPGQLVVVAARPGVGKSSLAESILLNVAKRGAFVGMCSLEQSVVEIGNRLLSRTSHVPLEAIRTRNIPQGDRARFVDAQNVVAEAAFSISERPKLGQIRAYARTIPRLQVLIVDYLQLVEPEFRSNVREQEVSQVSRGLKLLAKELGVCVVALAQLNRGIEKREKKVPVLSDLRESGAIEQDADVVIFLDRPNLYDSSADPTDARAYIAKQRNGPNNVKVDLKWKPELASFFSVNPFEFSDQYADPLVDF